MNTNPQVSSAPRKSQKTAKVALPVTKAEFDQFMVTMTRPDDWDFNAFSASQWGAMDMFLFAVRISNGNMHQQLKYDASSNEVVGNNSYLLEALNAYESPRKLFSPTSKLLDGPPGALPLLSFYTGTRDLMTYSANGGKKQKPTTTTTASTSSENQLIMSGMRIRKKRSVPEGFLMHDAFEKLALSDEESVKTTRTHRRNISEISFRSTFSESSDAMAMKVVDEGITSWVFNTFCTIT